jgi:asparagine synthase (glutamine-hydrolysing)
MCGICGIVNFNATHRVDDATIWKMTAAQTHRGPDAVGYFLDNNIALGHCRLSIIDQSGGSQPMFNEDGSVAVVFNGEIYNYADLTHELIAKGHRFRTRSDTETIVHSYEEYGEQCMQDFRGMFAFAVWDRRRKRLLLVRDRLGVKPLYYYAGTDFFIFASEIKALLEHPGVLSEVDPQALDVYLALRYVPGPGTMFKNIYKLQPGHSLVLEKGRIVTAKYWDIAYTADTHDPMPADDELTERFRRLLEESVRLRLIAEVPLGVFLSGGLDSTTVLAMVSRIRRGEPVKTFSVGYEAVGAGRKEVESANEFFFARQAAAHFGADHHEFRMSARDFEGAMPAVIAHLDEPMADATCLPLYFLSRLARNYVTVVLSGEGADETLAGYTLYRRILALDRLRQGAGPLAAALPQAAHLPVGNRVRSYLRRAGSRLEHHYRGVVQGIPLEVRRALTGADRLRGAEGLLDGLFGTYFSHVATTSTLNRMLYADAKVWLPEDLLLKADKMSMAAAIELRVPFLDHKLVEFSAALPDSWKIRNNVGKWILKQAAERDVPSAIVHRRKKGFPIPAGAWFRSDLRDFVRETLLARTAACKTFFDPRAVEEIVTLQQTRRTCGYQEVWSLLVFELWHRRFIERRSKNEPRCSQVLSGLW